MQLRKRAHVTYAEEKTPETQVNYRVSTIDGITPVEISRPTVRNRKKAEDAGYQYVVISIDSYRKCDDQHQFYTTLQEVNTHNIVSEWMKHDDLSSSALATFMMSNPQLETIRELRYVLQEWKRIPKLAFSVGDRVVHCKVRLWNRRIDLEAIVTSIDRTGWNVERKPRIEIEYTSLSDDLPQELIGRIARIHGGFVHEHDLRLVTPSQNDVFDEYFLDIHKNIVNEKKLRGVEDMRPLESEKVKVVWSIWTRYIEPVLRSVGTLVQGTSHKTVFAIKSDDEFYGLFGSHVKQIIYSERSRKTIIVSDENPFLVLYAPAAKKLWVRFSTHWVNGVPAGPQSAESQ